MSRAWKHRPLGDICELIGGGTPSKRNKAFYRGEIPWATVRDLNREILSSTEHHITPEAVAKSATNILPRGSVVIATRVGLGKVCLLDQDTAINQDLKGLVPKKGSNLDTRFLFRWFQSIAGRIEKAGTGLTVMGVRVPFIKALCIPLPPLTEQKRIVAFLDEVFLGIDAAVANTEKNLAAAQELFQSYLNSVFMPKREGWVKQRLGDLGPVQTGTTPSTASRANYGDFIPFIKPGDFGADGSLVYDNHGLSDLGLRSGRLIPRDSVLMVCIGATIGKAGVTERNVSANQQINALTPRGGALARFIYYQMTTVQFQNAVKTEAGQATLPIINKSKWSNLSLHIPGMAEQRAVVERLDSLYGRVKTLTDCIEQKIRLFSELKESILQKAFSGELTAAEKAAASAA